MKQIIIDSPSYSENGESSDDSSFQCSSMSQSSASSYSSTNDFLNMETREDSFLENMYQFVRECLSNDELMTRLKPKGDSGLSLKKKQVSIEQREAEPQLSSKYIKKPEYKSKISQKQSILDFVFQNKIQIIFIVLSIIMITVRASDLSNIYKEKSIKACFDDNSLQNKNDMKKMEECVKRIKFGQEKKPLLNSLQIVLIDYNQLFYMSIVSLALFSLVKNALATFSTQSYDEYCNNYQRIHNLSSQSKVKFSDLKSSYIQRQSQLKQNSGQNHFADSEIPQAKTINLFGISFNLNLQFLKRKNVKKDF